MKVYQILNEHNRPLYAFINHETAESEVTMLNMQFSDHHFYVAELEIDTPETEH